MNRATIAKTIAGMSVIGMCLGANAADYRTGFYAKVDAGVNLLQDTDLTRFPGGPDIKRNIEFDPGARVNLGVGYQFLDWLAAEIETGVSGNEIDSVSDAQFVDASVVSVPVMVNLISECNRIGPLKPFIGAGAGVHSTILDVDEISINNNTVFGGSEADAVFAWQAFAGLRYQISENWSVGLTYKFLWADDASWDVDQIGPGGFRVGSDEIEMDSLYSHAITLGFVFRF